jgi:putative ABC transport system ATP-binding protein
VLTLRAVSKTFATPTGDVALLRSVSLEIAEGARVAVVGASASGKSTLGLIATGLLLPDAGAVLVSGHDLTTLDTDGRARLRRREIGLVTSDALLCGSLTVLDNVCLPLSGPVPDREAREQGRALLASLSLDDAQDAFPDQLSPLNQRLVGLARAAVRLPRLLVADTGSRGLTLDGQRTFTDVLLRLQQRSGAALLMLCDDPAEGAACDTVLSLRDGTLAETWR